MQRLHATVEDFGEAGEVVDRTHLDARAAKLAGGAPGGDDLDAEIREAASEVGDPTLVRDREERRRTCTRPAETGSMPAALFISVAMLRAYRGTAPRAGASVAQMSLITAYGARDEPSEDDDPERTLPTRSSPRPSPQPASGNGRRLSAARRARSAVDLGQRLAGRQCA